MSRLSVFFRDENGATPSNRPHRRRISVAIIGVVGTVFDLNTTFTSISGALK